EFRRVLFRSRNTLFDRKSMLSNHVPFQNLASDHAPNDITVKKPSSQIVPPTSSAALGRSNPRVSMKYATAGSIRLIADVHAANVSSTKNRVATNAPPGICPNASGSDWNTSPGPEAGSRPFANTIGKITSPARSATEVSTTTTAKHERGIDSFSGKYAPYVITAPMPTLSVKNACPSASSTPLALSSSKRGSNRNTTPSMKLPLVML